MTNPHASHGSHGSHGSRGSRGSSGSRQSVDNKVTAVDETDTEMHEYAYAYHTPAPLEKMSKCAGINVYPRNGYTRQPRNILNSHIISSGSSVRETYDNVRLNQHPNEWDANDDHSQDRMNESGSSLYAEANVFHPRPVTVQPYDYRN